MLKSFWHSLDLYLLVPALLLTFLSFFVLSSFQPDLARSQAVYAVFGVLLYSAFSRLHPDVLRGYAFYIYLLILVSLVAVFFIGEISHGANRWLPLWGQYRLQPSEFAKPVLILCLARVFADNKKLSLKTIGFISLLTAVYFAFVYKQPDLGTALMFVVIYFVYFYLSQISLKTVGMVSAIVLVVVLIAAPVVWRSLHDYQRNRILTFTQPERDPLGTGYNVLQAIITVGSGGVYGKGFGRGTQSHNNFLPEQYTDFAFATFSEEFGFVGFAILITLYTVLLVRILHLTSRIRSKFGVFICVSVVFLILSQLFINMGMNMGIVPVAGITLPFFSYGGSSLISFLICLGLVQSVSVEKVDS
jgi:rod shape determining protein RodA